MLLGDVGQTVAGKILQGHSCAFLPVHQAGKTAQHHTGARLQLAHSGGQRRTFLGQDKLRLVRGSVAGIDALAAQGV